MSIKVCTWALEFVTKIKTFLYSVKRKVYQQIFGRPWKTHILFEIDINFMRSFSVQLLTFFHDNVFVITLT